MSAEAADTGVKKSADPLKLYCLIFLALVLVLGFLYVKRGNARRALETANISARLWFDDKQPRNAREDRPNDIPSMAFEIEQLVEAYVAAGGEDASTIQDARMKGFATKYYMTEAKSNADVWTPNSKGYTTLTRVYEYGPANLENLLGLSHTIDSSARYRVMEMSWVLQSGRDGNNVPPFHKIGRSTLKVALRKAVGKSG